jgi:hypothetical protein
MQRTLKFPRKCYLLVFHKFTNFSFVIFEPETKIGQFSEIVNYKPLYYNVTFNDLLYF